MLHVILGSRSSRRPRGAYKALVAGISRETPSCTGSAVIQSRSHPPLVWAPNSESLQTHYANIVNHPQNAAFAKQVAEVYLPGCPNNTAMQSLPDPRFHVWLLPTLPELPKVLN